MKTLLTIVLALFIFSCKQQPEKKNPVTSEINLLVSVKNYSLADIKVTLIQTKNDGKEFSCKSRLLISNDGKTIDSLQFKPEPVGGHYGISKPNSIDNHLVFTKHGDYDGRTIIVNGKGQVFNIMGGKNYYDPETNMLFAIYESDLSGFAVFDFKTDSLIFEMKEVKDRPISFHKAFGGRYFISCQNDDPNKNETTIWEIELSQKRIKQVDFDTKDINQANMLTTWDLEEVNCECEINGLTNL